MLVSIVSGTRLDRVPEALVERKLVRVEVLKSGPLCYPVWVATRAGRREAAKDE
jgi:hypothetical protein